MSPAIKSHWDSHSGGILLVCVVAAAATFLSEHYGAPVMLFALLIGMAFHFLNGDPAFSPGLEFAAKTLLRIGVALLGLRLSIGDVESVGLSAVAAVAGFVIATLACGAALSFLLGRRLAFGLLAGGSVAVCSEALQKTSKLPAEPLPRHSLTGGKSCRFTTSTNGQACRTCCCRRKQQEIHTSAQGSEPPSAGVGRRRLSAAQGPAWQTCITKAGFLLETPETDTYSARLRHTIAP
ncbi:putative sulfate exporter family transporter [Leisingera caerulea]|uniref:putative sulfate exporter family transporter n=1 Tax=Leisingera caerulea TaxID=506591 RepID=UPI0021A631A6|nr:putative sulfate exporter family transporter [Leisingera caerulea]